MKCSICQKEMDGGWSTGNNAQPVNDGRCCDECNVGVVIPARLHAVSHRQEEEEQEYWLYLISHNGYSRVVGEDDNWDVAHQMTGETGRLFAAAPELLARLKAMVSGMECECDKADPEHPLCDICWSRRVIAKAEGRTE